MNTHGVQEGVKSLMHSVSVAEDSYKGLEFRWRVQTAMHSMDEYSLKIALIDSHPKFRHETYVTTF